MKTMTRRDSLGRFVSFDDKIKQGKVAGAATAIVAVGVGALIVSAISALSGKKKEHSYIGIGSDCFSDFDLVNSNESHPYELGRDVTIEVRSV